MKCTALYMRRLAAACLIFFASLAVAFAEDATTNKTAVSNAFPDCVECKWEEVFGVETHDPDVFDVMILDPKSRTTVMLRNCISIMRIADNERSTKDPQFLRFKFYKNGKCKDTTIEIRSEIRLRRGGLGMSPPIVMTIYPAMEFSHSQKLSIPMNFVEVLGQLGYGGADESQQEIGFENLYYGAETMLGRYFTPNLAFALGAGILLEDGRDRYEALGHLRWRMTAPKLEQRVRFIPSACQFMGIQDTNALLSPGDAWKYYDSYRRLDSTVHMLHDSVAVSSSPDIFLFAEGGLLFDGSFEGSGRDPSENPEDYNQWFAGVGVGLIFNWFTFNLSYRHSRLNVRTPCENCFDPETEIRSIVNTNNVDAILLRLGWHMDW